jgi:hypothetical protein
LPPRGFEPSPYRCREEDRKNRQSRKGGKKKQAPVGNKGKAGRRDKETIEKGDTREKEMEPFHAAEEESCRGKGVEEEKKERENRGSLGTGKKIA